MNTGNFWFSFLEDVIEEIVGDISDEFDDDNVNFTKIDEKTIFFEGKINLKDFYRIIEINEEIFEMKRRLRPWLDLFLKYQEFPSEGPENFFSNCLFTIETVDKKTYKTDKSNG
jgi:CBS domain containing-hemolysin-like protein